MGSSIQEGGEDVGPSFPEPARLVAVGPSRSKQLRPGRGQHCERYPRGDVLVALENHLAAAAKASSAPDVLRLDEIQFPTLDLDVMKERYPLLRNAL